MSNAIRYRGVSVELRPHWSIGVPGRQDLEFNEQGCLVINLEDFTGTIVLGALPPPQTSPKADPQPKSLGLSSKVDCSTPWPPTAREVKGDSPTNASALSDMRTTSSGTSPKRRRDLSSGSTKRVSVQPHPLRDATDTTLPYGSLTQDSNDMEKLWAGFDQDLDAIKAAGAASRPGNLPAFSTSQCKPDESVTPEHTLADLPAGVFAPTQGSDGGHYPVDQMPSNKLSQASDLDQLSQGGSSAHDSDKENCPPHLVAKTPKSSSKRGGKSTPVEGRTQPAKKPRRATPVNAQKKPLAVQATPQEHRGVSVVTPGASPPAMASPVVALTPAPKTIPAVEVRALGLGGLEGTGKPPVGRWGHTATMITSTEMLVYGGEADDDMEGATLNHVHVYDIERDVWEEPMSNSGAMKGRVWHTATLKPQTVPTDPNRGQNMLIIFGGEREVDGVKETHSDLCVCELNIQLWYDREAGGARPTPRMGHSAVLIGEDLVVFGGSNGRKWLNTVSVLDTSIWMWRTPQIEGRAPEPRTFHSATAVNGMMVVFGGNNSKEIFSRVAVLDTTKPRWAWSYPEVMGLGPAPRCGHTATLLEDNRTLVIQGGWDPDDKGTTYHGDCFLLDTALWEWRRGPSVALPDDPKGQHARRVGHSAVAARVQGKRSLIFFGGQQASGERSAQLEAVSIVAA